MNRARIWIAVGIIVAIALLVLGVDLWRRSQVVELVPGGVPIYVGERLIGAFVPEDLDGLDSISFVDAEEGKPQDGWLLRDVLLLYVQEDKLRPTTTIVASSSSRSKSAQVTWQQASDPENYVMFDLSNRGTIKLVSKLEGLDTRDTWVQDVDKIEIVLK
jgi:hypothetical protein